MALGGLRNLFSKAADTVGTALGLPELGISEGLSTSGTSQFSGNTPQSSSVGVRPTNYLNPQTNVSAAKAPSLKYGGSLPPAMSASNPRLLGASDTNTSTPNTQTAIDSLKTSTQQAVDQSANNAETQFQQQLAQNKQNISNSFDQITNELDRRIGMTQLNGALPDINNAIQTKQGQSVQSVYDTGVQGLTGVRDAGLAGLQGLRGNAEMNAEAARQDVRNEVGQNLREIDDSARNASTSFMRRLGVAGDSSAAVVGSEAIAREALKQRGQQLGLRTELLEDIGGQLNNIVADIDQKGFQVEQLYQQQKADLGNWKQQQLASIVSAAEQQYNELQAAKAQANSDEINALNDIENQLRNNLSTRLQQLDDYMRDVNFSLDQWGVERIAQLEDYKNQLATAASYSGGSTPNLQFKTLSTQDQLGNSSTIPVVFNPATGQYEYGDPIQGQLAPEQEEERGFLASLFN